MFHSSPGYEDVLISGFYHFSLLAFMSCLKYLCFLYVSLTFDRWKLAKLFSVSSLYIDFNYIMFLICMEG